MTDPTPPAAPRPCECGHDESWHNAKRSCWRDGCDCREYRPVSPEAARDEKLCPECHCALRLNFVESRPAESYYFCPDHGKQNVSPEAAPPRTGIEVRPGVYHVAPNDGDERPDEDEFTEAAPPRATTDGGTGVTLPGCAQCVNGRRYTEGGVFPCPDCAPPRATTPPMTDKRLAEIREWATGRYAEGNVRELLAEVDRLRAPLAAHPATTPACQHPMRIHNYTTPTGWEEGVCGEPMPCAIHGSPSRESGALVEALVEAAYAHGWVIGSKRQKLDAARDAVDRRLSTLERDAARMREGRDQAMRMWESLRDTVAHTEGVLQRLASPTHYALDAAEDQHARREEARAALAKLRAALREPTTTPETSE